jgi:uncharacterized protein YbjT (DUF2867 family)
MTRPLILLAGATGQVGSRVAEALVARGAWVRALVRDVQAAKERLSPAVELVRGDLDDPPSLVAALRGVDVASLATAPTPRLAVQEANFIDAALAAGLPRVVKLSATGNRLAPPDAPPFGWHAASEARISKAGIPATLLRPTPFHSLLYFDAVTVRAGVLQSLLGRSRLSFIDPQDVAELTVAALTDASYAGQVWDVGGPEALTYPQVAGILSRRLGHPVRFADIDEAAFRARLREARLPDLLGDVFAATAELARQDLFAVDDTVVRQVLGRPAGSLASWVDRNRSAFKR